MTQNSKKILALKQASQDKAKDTQLKVATVMRVMKEKNLPINFESVSKLSGVSKTWLYRQPELSDEINLLRKKSGKIKRVIDLKDATEKKDIQIKELKNKNASLKAEIKKLRYQIEVIYGEL
jgi:hypothetical protein